MLDLAALGVKLSCFSGTNLTRAIAFMLASTYGLGPFDKNRPARLMFDVQRTIRSSWLPGVMFSGQSANSITKT